MTLWKVVTLVIVLVSIGAPLVAGSAPTWLSQAVKSVVFGLAPPVAGAVVLVAYFNWRARFKRRIRRRSGAIRGRSSYPPAATTIISD